MAVLPCYLSKKAIIAAGQSQSSVVDSECFETVGVIMPDDWTTAKLSFLVSNSPDGPWTPLYSEAGTELAMTVAAKSAYTLVTCAGPWRYFKFRSGVNATPVNQVAERILIVSMRL